MLSALEGRAKDKKVIITEQLASEKDPKKLELLRSLDREIVSYLSRVGSSPLSLDSKDTVTPSSRIDTFARELRSLESRISRLGI